MTWMADFINKFLAPKDEEELNQWEYVEYVPTAPEKVKPIKELFLAFVERNNNAWDCKQSYGPDDRRTIEAFKVANDYKRKVLDMLEQKE